VSKWIDKFKGDYVVFARIRLGSASTLESMGLVEFAYNVYDNPDLIKEIHRRFSEWSAKVVEHLNQMDFDYYWANDDHADTKSTWMSREQYQEFFLPIKKWWPKQLRNPGFFIAMVISFQS